MDAEAPSSVYLLLNRYIERYARIEIEPLVFAQEPDGPVSLKWVPAKLIRIVG